MILAFLLLGCPAADDTDAGETDDVVDSDADSDVPDTDVAVEDVDQDGHFTPSDCDDYDPAVHPGASEAWNGDDDDCDGVVDANGAYAGTERVDASVIYEGKRHDWTLDCPSTLERTGSSFTFTVTCTPPPEDALAVQLLGESFVVEEIENVATAGAWAGLLRVTSSDGWDTDGTGTLTWSGFDETALRLTVDAAFLELSGTGTLARP